MKKVLLITLLIFSQFLNAQSKGTLTGTITDKEANNEALPFANVLIKGTTIGATTDFDGRYTIQVPAGNHIVVFSFLGYKTIEKPFSIKAGQTVTINQLLSAEEGVSLDEVKITANTSKEKASALLIEQKKATIIKESIGSQELSRKAVTNVEQGLTKISGVTTVQDRGIFVRGLDDRYNYLLINGLPIASSDPDNKIIPLNYISTSIVGYVDVLKTFNSSVYQDFAGATFQINTKEASAKDETTISVGFGLNTNTSLKEFKTDNSGDSEFFGFNGSGRRLPAQFNKFASFGYIATPSESANLFNTSWTPEISKAPLESRFGISHSQKIFRNAKNSLGLFFSLNYRNSYLTQQGLERTLNSEGTAQQDFASTNYTFNTQKSGLFTLNFKHNDNLNLTFNTIFIQNSSNFIREAKGLNDNFTQLNSQDFYIRDIRYTENDLISFQLLGDYSWAEKKHQLTFGGSLGLGNNNIPDRRVLRTAGSGANAEYITTNGIDPFKFYQQLENINGNAKIEYQLGLDKDEDDKFNTIIKVGYNGDAIKYDFFNRFITVDLNNANQVSTIDTDNPQAFFDQGFANGNLFYTNTADPQARSRIRQYINAGYVDFSREWNKFFVEVGVRGEYAYRKILFREPLNSVTDPYKKLEYDPFDISPSLNIKYTINDKSNLRFAGSRTVTRPRLREILPTAFQDGDGNQILGNPNLINSTNLNADLKFEIFPSSSELLSFTLFGKLIDNPIERLSRATSVGYTTFFDNFENATIYGIELETKMNVGNVFKNDNFDKLNFGFNGILMNSEANADLSNPDFAAITNKQRKLQGASDWGINADLSYDIISNEKFDTTVNLIFNTYGKRIFAVGVEGANDIFEKPINQLDFSWSANFNKKINVRLNIRNILNEKTLFTQDATQSIRFPERYSNVIETFNQGTNISLNLTYKI